MGDIYKTTIDGGDLGDIDVVVVYDYQPAERQTYNYPGCDASVEVTAVVASGIVLSPRVEAHLIEFMHGKWEQDIIDYENEKAEEAQCDYL